jgi:hypothetical protein
MTAWFVPNVAPFAAAVGVTAIIRVHVGYSLMRLCDVLLGIFNICFFFVIFFE